MRYATSFCNQSDRGAIEAGEDLAAAPSAFEGDSTVSKVAAGGQHRKASLDGWPVRRAHFQTAVRQQRHLHFLAGGDAEVPQHFLAERPVLSR